MHQATRTRLFLACTLGAMLALTACGGQPPANPGAGSAKPTPAAEAKPTVAVEAKPTAKPVSAGTGKATTVEVTVKNYVITPNVTEIPAGDVTFNVTNASADLEHEMVVVRTDQAPDALPYDQATQKINEDALDALGEVSEMKPGTSGAVTINLTPGKYLLICNILSHFKKGMATPIVVTP